MEYGEKIQKHGKNLVFVGFGNETLEEKWGLNLFLETSDKKVLVSGVFGADCETEYFVEESVFDEVEEQEQIKNEL